MKSTVLFHIFLLDAPNFCRADGSEERVEVFVAQGIVGMPSSGIRRKEPDDFPLSVALVLLSLELPENGFHQGLLESS